MPRDDILLLARGDLRLVVLGGQRLDLASLFRGRLLLLLLRFPPKTVDETYLRGVSACVVDIAGASAATNAAVAALIATAALAALAVLAVLLGDFAVLG